jgi:hypothetical protein
MAAHRLDRIAFFGPMASGKTWCADYLVKEHGYIKISFAGKLKEIAADLFGVHGKDGADRLVLQQLGQKMREIRENVWIDYILKGLDNSYTYSYDENDQIKCRPMRFVLDDLRYVNEADALRKAGFTLIIASAPDSIREQRLAMLYPNIDPASYYHDSEQEWKRIDPDATVYSVGPRAISDIEKFLAEKVEVF